MIKQKSAFIPLIIILVAITALTGCTTNQKIPIANATANTAGLLQNQTQTITQETQQTTTSKQTTHTAQKTTYKKLPYYIQQPTPKYITRLDAYRSGDLYEISFKLASENNQEITESKPPIIGAQATIKDSINDTLYNGSVTLTTLQYDPTFGYMFAIPVEDTQPSKTSETLGTLYLKIKVSDKIQLNTSTDISSLPTLSDEQIKQYWEQKYQKTAKPKQATTQVGNIKITATKAGPWDTIDLNLLWGPIKKYYRVDLKIKNTGNTIEYPISSPKLIINGKEYEDKAFLVLPLDQESCNLLSIAPGATKTCTLLFPRPQETSGTAKIYLGTNYDSYPVEQPIFLTFQYP